ncbi:hypothetical protein F5887DRAFT_599909 [Amanita rubescens]|nr:hypothetical protein F5887DRAFT_599909 [Amanita rubescens]
MLFRVSSKLPQIRVHKRFTSLQSFRNVQSIDINTPSLYPPSKKFEPEEDSLLSLVQEKRFGAAERVLNKLIDSNKLHTITPHPAYEEAAIAALQWDNRRQAQELFGLWFKLVPHINHPSARLITPIKATGLFLNTPFNRTIQTLMQSGRPSSHVPLIKDFALICASKGYINYVYNWVVEPLPRFGLPATEYAQFLNDIEAAAVKYEAPNYPTAKACALAGQLRIAAIQILCRREWYKNATKILIRNASDEYVVLPDEVYEYIIRLVNAADSRNSIPSPGRVQFVQSLRKDENIKRQNLRFLPRPQVNINFSDANQPDSAPHHTEYSPEFADIAFSADVRSHLGQYSNPLLSVTTRLDLCSARLRQLEKKLLIGRRLGLARVAGLFHDILILQSLVPSGPNGMDRYTDAASEYLRLRAIAFSSPRVRHAIRWLSAEIFVFDFKHKPDDIFSRIYTYYSLSDVPKNYSTSFLEHTDDEAWKERNEPRPRVSMEDRLVLEPTSRESAVLLKWLIIKFCRFSKDPGGSLERLWSAFRTINWEAGVVGVPDSPDETWGEGHLVFKRTLLEVLAAFVWMSCKKRIYHAFVVYASKTLPLSGTVFAPTTIEWLREIWQSLRSQLQGRDPTWQEFLLFVQYEDGQDQLAEMYLRPTRGG